MDILTNTTDIVNIPKPALFKNFTYSGSLSLDTQIKEISTSSGVVYVVDNTEQLNVLNQNVMEFKILFLVAFFFWFISYIMNLTFTVVGKKL